ncbi:DUF2306 domain-containing protein [Asticcacaulis sp. ZE23SCel15]|uniref:DUF2306 domain-containing protein n=1 Tax=Asticcacaulis sp. ZE23SCel15 TaxID=3059027 RepID=UPI00265E9A55|nr:DUF2306 domain-containing protein [Asticcacaulis sp. ZE23SCel15]WKL58195.1 DUF2306 domain-containing protein [Asticcacaulis sp. ZE23SCel15]
MVRKLLLQFILPTLLTVGIIYLALQSMDTNVRGRMVSAAETFVPHAPNWALIMLQPAAIQIHIAAAASAFVIGLVQFLGPKGKMPHRILGWIWVGLMLITAISSFFIREINQGSFSLIHLLSGWTAVSSPMIIYAARKGNIKQHRNAAISLFMGGLIIAGALTFMPGRLMWRVFFG